MHHLTHIYGKYTECCTIIITKSKMKKRKTYNKSICNQPWWLLRCVSIRPNCFFTTTKLDSSNSFNNANTANNKFSFVFWVNSIAATLEFSKHTYSNKRTSIVEISFAWIQVQHTLKVYYTLYIIQIIFNLNEKVLL